MRHAQPARPTTRRIRIRRTRVAALLAAIAAIAAALDHQWPTSSSSATSPRGEHRVLALPPDDPPRAAGGTAPVDTTVFDDRVAAIANLDPVLLGALRQAATDAADEGVRIVVNSGWRTAEYQGRLLQEAIAKYGSKREAARWVATPARSAHVSGDAVDIGPSEAAAWLSRNGVRYGLCQIYGNEPWHYELRPDTSAHGCPPVYADPTHDPKMQP